MIRSILLVLLFAVSARADSGPIRVLFVGKESPDHTSGKRSHVLMRDLGRDAIWFDYATGATPAPVEFERYDAVAVKSPFSHPFRLPMLVVKTDTTPESFRRELEAAEGRATFTLISCSFDADAYKNAF